MGAHHAGRKTWAPGRHHRLNQALEALLVIALIAAAAFAGWVSTVAPRAPASVLNPPVVAAIPSRPTEPPVPPVPAGWLGHGNVATPAPQPKQKKVSTTKKAARPTPRGRS